MYIHTYIHAQCVFIHTHTRFADVYTQMCAHTLTVFVYPECTYIPTMYVRISTERSPQRMCIYGVYMQVCMYACIYVCMLYIHVPEEIHQYIAYAYVYIDPNIHTRLQTGFKGNTYTAAGPRFASSGMYTCTCINMYMGVCV